MLILVVIAALLAPAAMSVTAAARPRPGGGEPVVAAYFANWNLHAQNPYSAADIPAQKLNHVFYAFGAFDEQGRCALDNPRADVEEPLPGDGNAPGALHGNFHQLQLLKQRYPHLRTAISLGGGIGSGPFSDVAATAESRQKYVSSCIELYLKKWPGIFDGIDVDWEFPVHGGPQQGRPEDRHNATLLFAEFRRQLDELGARTGRYYELSAAMPAGRWQYGGSYDVSSSFELRASAEYLDFINVMAYSMNNRLVERTDFNAPFAASSADPQPQPDKFWNNIVNGVLFYQLHGVPRNKIVLGLPFYGQRSSGVPGANNGLYQKWTTWHGETPYTDIAAKYLPTYQRHWDTAARSPWLYDPASKDFITYDDPRSIAVKAGWARHTGLGGAMIWEISEDDAKHSMTDALASGLR